MNNLLWKVSPEKRDGHYGWIAELFIPTGWKVDPGTHYGRGWHREPWVLKDLGLLLGTSQEGLFPLDWHP